MQLFTPLNIVNLDIRWILEEKIEKKEIDFVYCSGMEQQTG